MSRSTAPIAVTGATGELGGRIARRLAAAGIQQRLLVRDLARAPQLPDAEPVRAPYGDGEAVREALTGTTIALMVSGSEAVDRVEQHRTFIDAAVDAGVEHLVYISFSGAAADATFTLARDHWATEQHILDRGLAATFLRDNLYLDLVPALVGDDGTIRGPAGDGRVAAVARDDIAEAAVAILLDAAAHRGETYELTGPEAFSFAEAAARLTSITGRAVTYVDETVDEAYASRASYGAPDWLLDAWVSTYLAVADGSLATVTTAIPELTGHRARTLEEVLGGSPRMPSGRSDPEAPS